MNASQSTSTAGADSGASRSSGIGAEARGLADDAKQSAEAFAEERKSTRPSNGFTASPRLWAGSPIRSRTSRPQWPIGCARQPMGSTTFPATSRTKSVGDLLDMAKGFARREPAAFIAASAVAGFALSRLLKSSAAAPASAAASSPSYGTVGYSPSKGFDTTTPTSSTVGASPVSAPSATPSSSDAAGRSTPPGVKPASDVDPALAPDTGASSPLASGSLASLKTKAGDPSI